jgi:Methyltransferase domain
MNEEMHISPCDLCESNQGIKAPYTDLYTGGQPLYICSSCGLVFVRERRDASLIAQDWNACYGTVNPKYGNGYTTKIPAISARLHYVAGTLSQELDLASSRVVDIGAGEGTFLDILKAQSNAVPFGIEPSKENCGIMESLNIESFHGTVEDFYQAYNRERQFDIATILWTLEACSSASAMLKICHNLLTENGYIVISTGSRILVPFKKPLQNYLKPMPQDMHPYRFSAQTLRAILIRAGFEPVYINSFIDSDVLLVIGQKKDIDRQRWSQYKDDPLKVHHFFERWHAESVWY